jgi:aminoglycoside 6'-N-acetyltransferase
MVVADLRLLHTWLQRPHVSRWYRERGDYDAIVAHYGPALDGRDPTDHYIALLDDRPIGMLQTYVVSDHPAYATLIAVADDVTAGVDILIGDEELTGQGLGTTILRRFVDEIVFARTETLRCVADPEVQNVASVRAFEKAGFRSITEFVDPGDGQVHVLVRRER